MSDERDPTPTPSLPTSSADAERPAVPTAAADPALVATPDTRSPVRELRALWIVLLALSAAVASLLQVALERPEHGFFVLTVTFAICGAAVFLDVATRSIPNALTYPAVLLGIALNLVLAPLLRALDAGAALSWLGAPSFQDALFGLGVCAAFGMGSFAMRGLGGGDAKVVIALGVLLGMPHAIAVLFHALLFAAVIGLVNWAARGTLVPRLQVVTQNMLAALFSKQRFRDAYPFEPSEAPFALSLFLGLVLAQFVRLHVLLVDAISTIG